MARLGDYMYSATGYGEYGNFGAAGDLFSKVLSVGKAVAGGAVQVGGAALFEQVELMTPAELKGAKLSRAFKVEKAGEKYRIVIDMGAANKLIPGGIPAPVQSVIGNFTGADIPDINKDFEVSLAPIGTIKYTAPPKNFAMYAGIAVAAVVVILIAMKMKG